MQIHSAQAALDFIYGGNATFTIVSLSTGKRYTYRVRAPEDGGALRFVSVLTGPDNGADFTYLGTLWSLDGRGFVAGAKGNPNHPAFAALDWMLLCLRRGRMPVTAEFWHEGRCARCNRKLTTPESIESGFGPECAKRKAPA